MSRVMVPMPDGVILDPVMIADRARWLFFVKPAYRNFRRRGHWPLMAFRKAVWSANHGTRHDGAVYRCCYRMKLVEHE